MKGNYITLEIHPFSISIIAAGRVCTILGPKTLLKQVPLSDRPLPLLRRAATVTWQKTTTLPCTVVGVSKNRGTPKSSILIGISIINHPFWDTPIFGNTLVLRVHMKDDFWYCTIWKCTKSVLVYLIQPVHMHAPIRIQWRNNPKNYQTSTQCRTLMCHMHVSFFTCFPIQLRLPPICQRSQTLVLSL